MSNDSSIYLCSIYQMTGKYKEAFDTIKSLIYNRSSFSKTECEIFSSLYKSFIDSKRNSLELYSSILCNSNYHKNSKYIDFYQEKYQNDIYGLKNICEEAIFIIDNILIPTIKNETILIYLFKFKGDIFRYLSEFLDDKNPHSYIEKSEEFYKLAIKLSDEYLEKYDPIRLSLILNVSIFFYKFKKDIESAINTINIALEVQDLSKDKKALLSKKLKDLEKNRFNF